LGGKELLAAELCSAAAQGDIPRMRDALKGGAIVDSFSGNWSALMFAAANGQKKAAYFLISQGAAVDLQAEVGGVTALMLAAGTGHLAIVKKLVSSGADVFLTDDNRSTAVGYAITHGHRRIARYLASRMAAKKKELNRG
jgi:ankyrin repeat protein